MTIVQRLLLRIAACSATSFACCVILDNVALGDNVKWYFEGAKCIAPTLGISIAAIAAIMDAAEHSR